MVQRKNVAVIGSGAGSGAEAICTYALNADCAYAVALIVSTSPGAGMYTVAAAHSIPLRVLDPEKDIAGQISDLMIEYGIELLALAGFMKLLPTQIIEQLGGRVLNIHPALLPSFGGKGMYGIHVHKAVIAAKALKTGATVHLVTEQYDEGRIIAQDYVDVPTNCTAQELQILVKNVEHRIYPQTISAFLRNT